MGQPMLYVNPATGKDNSVGNSSAPLKTLTRALKQAQAGTSIQLASGIYNAAGGEVFPLVIPAGVTVVGNESSKGKGIQIEGSGEYISPSFGSQNITLRLETDAQLRGVSVTNRGAKGTGVWIESTSPRLANNTFTSCSRDGVFVTGTAKPAILDNVFTQNASTGLSLVRNAKGEVRRNVAERTGYGILIGDQAAPLITDNKIFANRAGIFLSRDATPVLRRNLIEKNTQAGLIINDGAKPQLGSRQEPAGNILRDNGEVDLQNLTRFAVVSAGNQLNPVRVQGTVEFVAATVAATFTMGPAQFSDVAGYWAEAFIQALVAKNLMSGFPDGTFQPEAAMTRAQYAAAIAKTFNLPPRPGNQSSFKDIPADFWAARAIAKAASMGFISGFPDNTFRPGQNLTRVQAIASLVSGLALTGGNSSVLGVYGDRAQIPSYATDAVAVATTRRMVVNYPQVQQLEPMRDITRAEVAALIYQALVTTGEVKAIASPYIVNPEVNPDSSLPSFSDIQGHWAENSIRGLANQNLLGGFADATFKPDDRLNRAGFAALLVKAFNPTSKRPAIQFTDIPPTFWAQSVIQQAYSGGFITGFPDQTFRPQQPVLRVQLIVSLVSGLGFASGDEKLLDKYEDRAAIPAYARPAVAAATQRGIIVNHPAPAQLNPNREATRAEAAAMVYQALVATGRLPAS
ncbi:S-layer homology domain-containing protein [Coleofasciculus sp. FACHB-SPT9]|uniref:S-layer homology domain-containing protein n=1 Tax=Cyanophyceae TaxID=3028117 RepID=UPI0016876C23|nr:S-layer homology domain-containing protein [Coleofasciculus sp. FACHB-SPT9]MBD1892469.1 S-layer homology domain-containing protein [Coleofasciculus sp. FACHB-SPT9]